MPFPADDPLASVGLEEAGAPDDSAWSGPDEWPQATDERADRAEARIPSGETSAWDSPQNPYKAKYDELSARVAKDSPTVAQKLHSTLTVLQQQAAEAWDQAVRSGIQPKLAEQLISVELDRQSARAELEATRE